MIREEMMGFGFRIFLCLLLPAVLALAVAVWGARALTADILGSSQEERVLFRLDTLVQSLEANLSLGFQLKQMGVTQDLIETARARDNTFVAIEVFSVDGISLYSTDRGIRGEQVPAGWTSAIGQAGKDGTWRYERQGELVLGKPVRNDLDEIVGYLVGVTVPPKTFRQELFPGLATASLLLVPAIVLASILVALALAGRIGRPFAALARDLRDGPADPGGAASAAREKKALLIDDLERAMARVEAIDNAL